VTSSSLLRDCDNSANLVIPADRLRNYARPLHLRSRKPRQRLSGKSSRPALEIRKRSRLARGTLRGVTDQRGGRAWPGTQRRGVAPPPRLALPVKCFPSSPLAFPEAARQRGYPGSLGSKKRPSSHPNYSRRDPGSRAEATVARACTAAAALGRERKGRGARKLWPFVPGLSSIFVRIPEHSSRLHSHLSTCVPGSRASGYPGSRRRATRKAPP